MNCLHLLKRIAGCLLAGMLALCVLPMTAAAAVRVAILPFAVNAEEDLGYLRQAIPR